MSERSSSGRTLIALALVAAGALWLLVEVGFVPTALLAVLVSWWPVFLIGAGLDVAFPRSRPSWLPYTVLAGLVVVALALFGVGKAATADRSLDVDRHPTVRSATITLELGSSPAAISQAGDSKLLTTHVTGQPQADVTSRIGPTATIDVRPLPGANLPFLGRGRWVVGLPTDVPVDLEIIGRSATSTIDLTNVRLDSLVIAAGSGRLTTDLPGVGSVYRATLTGGSGHITLRVAPGASLDLDARFGSGSSDVFVGEGTDMRLALRTGSGPLTLDLPDTAPVRLTITDDGSGRVTLPGYLVRRSGSGETGVWESRNLELGGRVIEVTVSGAGSGRITIR